MTVTVYTHSLCPFSKQLEDYLHTNTILYTAVVLDHQPEKLEEFKAANGGFNGVPFTVITKDDGTVVTVRGFNETELAHYLLGIPDPKAVDDKTQPAAQPSTDPAGTPAQAVSAPAASPDATQAPIAADQNGMAGTAPVQTDPSQTPQASTAQAPYTPLPEANNAMNPSLDPNTQQQPQEPIQTFAADGTLMQPTPQIVT